MTKSSIIFTAAGSGGHIFAAIATLKAFTTLYPSQAKDLVFVGSTLTMEGEKHQLPMEERLCNRMGIPFRKIRMGKLQRQLSLRSFKLAYQVVLGFIDAFKLIKELRPSVVVAFGGYVALPMVIIGKLFGAKIVLHEQTSNIGLTNRLLQYFADTIGVTFEASQRYFKRPTKVVGSPTMEHIYSISTYEHLLAYIKKEKSKLLDEPDYLEKLQWIKANQGQIPILLMSGGSQGSHFLNEQIKMILPELLKESIVIMQVGENEQYNDYKVLTDLVSTLTPELQKNCIIRKFVYEEYGFLMKTADVFLGRSGANTVYQAGMNSLHSLFVPIPWVTRNEQYTNAMILQEKGFATIIEQAHCTPEVLLEEIKKNFAHIYPTESVQENDHTDLHDTPLFPLDADKKMALEISKLAAI